jgi:xylan 1,4-beta-xylosidase
LTLDGSHPTVDAWAVRGPRGVTVLLTNHALPRQPVHTEHVRLELADAPAPQSVILERIDEEHANPKRRWQEMGEPEYLTRHQVEDLERASRLGPVPLAFDHRAGVLRVDLDLPPNGVAAVTVTTAGD